MFTVKRSIALELSIRTIEEAGGTSNDIIRTRILLTDISGLEQAA
jgi:hypothetical protein